MLQNHFIALNNVVQQTTGLKGIYRICAILDNKLAQKTQTLERTMCSCFLSSELNDRSSAFYWPPFGTILIHISWQKISSLNTGIEAVSELKISPNVLHFEIFRVILFIFSLHTHIPSCQLGICARKLLLITLIAINMRHAMDLTLSEISPNTSIVHSCAEVDFHISIYPDRGYLYMLIFFVELKCFISNRFFFLLVRSKNNCYCGIIGLFPFHWHHCSHLSRVASKSWILLSLWHSSYTLKICVL